MIHPLSDVKSSKIGENTSIWQFVIILPGAEIGSNCNINCNVFIEDDVIIGDRVTIKPGVQVWNGIRIQNDVFIGPNVTFTNDLRPRSKIYPEKFLITVLHDFVSIGANATLLGGIEIGKYAMVAAGSVVTKTVPERALVLGNPAKIAGWLNDDGTKMEFDGTKYIDKYGNTWIVEEGALKTLK